MALKKLLLARSVGHSKFDSHDGNFLVLALLNENSFNSREKNESHSMESHKIISLMK